MQLPRQALIPAQAGFTWVVVMVAENLQFAPCSMLWRPTLCSSYFGPISRTDALVPFLRRAICCWQNKTKHRIPSLIPNLVISFSLSIPTWRRRGLFLHSVLQLYKPNVGALRAQYFFLLGFAKKRSYLAQCCPRSREILAARASFLVRAGSSKNHNIPSSHVCTMALIVGKWGLPRMLSMTRQKTWPLVFFEKVFLLPGWNIKLFLRCFGTFDQTYPSKKRFFQERPSVIFFYLVMKTFLPYLLFKISKPWCRNGFRQKQKSGV